jgi:hypothetical protein
MKRVPVNRHRLLVHLRTAARAAFIAFGFLAVSTWALPVKADDQPNRIIIEYVPPQDPAHQLMYDWLREHHVLEKSKELFSPFRLPTDLVLRLQGCDGKVNAWFPAPPPATPPRCPAPR